MGSSGRDADAGSEENSGDAETADLAEHDSETRSGDSETRPGDREGEDAATPTEVGDDRRKYVEVIDRSGNRTEHVEVYFRHATEEFVVSRRESFSPAETTRYPKAELLRVEISQHHSVCFLTTATVGEGDRLESLRGFRDDVLRTRPAGRALVGLYYRVSPPVARTLSAHPEGWTTGVVRWLISRSAGLERRRKRATLRPYRRALALSLTLTYALGLACALAGHAAIRLRESLAYLTPTTRQ